MDNLSMEMKSNFEELWDLSSADLEIELGRRIATIRSEYETSPQLSDARPTPPQLDSAKLMGSVDFLQDLARTFLDRFNHQMYALICDPSDPDNPKTLAALEIGVEHFGIFLGGVLVANFGMLPGIAVIVAAILAKRFASAAHMAVCDTWKAQL